ncbi:hypothetical protein SAMN05216262_101160 [Colwellia chukchiensis]|uniref:Uncharacterized protein n=1 Tax=Colwellia chukchiensis TaxID=641665 RepID=A0A1H7GGR0_9GAMM|nr:hypothetical protein SAMN05216262_101160 [Colwellia chukchiensis]
MTLFKRVTCNSLSIALVLFSGLLSSKTVYVNNLQWPPFFL